MSHTAAQWSAARTPRLAALLVDLAGRSEFVPRGVLRLVYEQRDIDHGRVDRKDGTGRKSSNRLSKDLAVLEAAGLIERHPGYVKVLNYPALIGLAAAA